MAWDSDLKPCPLCGEHRWSHMWPAGPLDDPDNDVWMVRCGACERDTNVDDLVMTAEMAR